MKYLTPLIAVVALVIALLSYSHAPSALSLGATGTRWPNGVSANTNSPIAGQLRGTTVKLDALSCVQVSATSSATAIKLVFATTGATSTYNGTAYWQYGTCP